MNQMKEFRPSPFPPSSPPLREGYLSSLWLEKKALSRSILKRLVGRHFVMEQATVSIALWPLWHWGRWVGKVGTLSNGASVFLHHWKQASLLPPHMHAHAQHAGERQGDVGSQWSKPLAQTENTPQGTHEHRRRQRGRFVMEQGG